MSKHIAIVGGGIAGITTAYFLLKRGMHVTIYDRHPYLAQECTYANGGQLSVSNSEVWTTWKNVKKGLKWMMSKDAPLALRMDHWSIPKIKWIAGFLGATIGNKYDENTRTTIALAIESVDWLKEVTKELKLDYDQYGCGILHLYRNEQSLNGAKEACAQFADTGWGRKLVDIEEVRQKVTHLKADEFIGATFTPNDFTGDVNMFTNSLGDRLKKKYAERFFYSQMEIDRKGLDILTSQYDEVVICAGAYTPFLVPCNIYPVKGYSVTFESDKLPNVSLLDEDTKIVTSSFKGRFRVAGTAELAGWNHDIRHERIKPLIDWTRRYTDVDTQNTSRWACLRPMTPNMLPIIERREGVIINSGAGHLGWTMSMALAKRASDLIE